MLIIKKLKLPFTSPMEKKPGSEKKEEPDYYMENGFVVFTEAFLRKRGYCCKKGCRHCPYGFKKAGNDKLERG